MKNFLIYFFTIILLISLFYFAIVFTDCMRFKKGNVPIFAMSIKTDKTEEGFENTFIGLGYKLNELENKKMYSKKITFFGKILYENTNSYEK